MTNLKENYSKSNKSKKGSNPRMKLLSQLIKKSRKNNSKKIAKIRRPKLYKIKSQFPTSLKIKSASN